MRPIWTGSISFGLLQVPVQLFSATRDIDLHFRMLDGRDKKPIRYERVNSDSGEEVPWKEIVKAYEVKKGSFLVVDEKELKAAAPEQTQTIDLEAFVDRCDIDPIYYEKPYYVAPAKKSEKAYSLLHAALQKTRKVGIARVVIRTRQYLAALLPEKTSLMLTLMRFDEEVVSPKTVGITTTKAPKVSAAELEMADKLLQSMSKKWDPSDYKDEFRTKLRAMLDRKAKRGSMVKAPTKTKPEEDEGGKIIDLVAVLQQSLGGKAKPRRSKASTSRRPAKRSAR
ncbi:MAG: Ku protein [Polyangia bacterium]